MFNGATYSASHDEARLSTQLSRIHICMSDNKWRTLTEISQITGAPECSVSRQLRYLKKPEHGGYLLNKRARGERSRGLFEYQIEEPALKPYTTTDERSHHHD